MSIQSEHSYCIYHENTLFNEHVLCPPPSNLFYFILFIEVCCILGEEVPMVCLLGRPWDPVFSRPWDWPAHLPPLSGEKTCFCCLATKSVNTSS